MRQQDVEKLIRQYGHERGVVHVLLRLAEEQAVHEKLIKEMAQAFAGLAEVVNLQNSVADGMKEKIDGMSRHFDTDPRSTHAIVRSVKEFDNE